MDIEFRHLRQFCAVAEEKSFSRAAKRLGMAQPPLSQAIRKLEDNLGTRLFVRTSRSVQVTEPGRLLYEQAGPLLAQHERVVRNTRKAADGAVGHLHICFVMSASYALLPRVLRRFAEQAPDVTIDLSELPTAQQVDALTSGRCDIGLLRPPIFGADGLVVETILREPIMVVLPDDHRLAAHDVVDLSDLADEPFVAPPAKLGPGLYGRLVDCCLTAGFAPRIAQEANQMQTIVSLVAGGLGVALVPSSVAALGLEGVVYRELRSSTAMPTADLAVAYRPETPRQRAYIRDFTDLLKDVTARQVDV